MLSGCKFFLPNSRQKGSGAEAGCSGGRSARSACWETVGQSQSRGHPGCKLECGVFGWAQCCPLVTKEEEGIYTREEIGILFHVAHIQVV